MPEWIMVFLLTGLPCNNFRSCLRSPNLPGVSVINCSNKGECAISATGAARCRPFLAIRKASSMAWCAAPFHPASALHRPAVHESGPVLTRVLLVRSSNTEPSCSMAISACPDGCVGPNRRLRQRAVQRDLVDVRDLPGRARPKRRPRSSGPASA